MSRAGSTRLAASLAAVVVAGCMSRAAPASAPGGAVDTQSTTPGQTAPVPSAASSEVTALAAAPTAPGVSVTTRLEIFNSGSAPVCGLFVAPVSDGAWGDDRLGEGRTVPPGSTHSLVLPAGDYDVRVTGCSDDVLVERSALSVRGAGVRVGVR